MGLVHLLHFLVHLLLVGQPRHLGFEHDDVHTSGASISWAFDGVLIKRFGNNLLKDLYQLAA
jgi:hypothetical protein